MKLDELRMEMWPTEKLIEYARNPRQNDQVIPKMVASIKEFGFRIPVVAKSDGTVVDGHLRLKAAREMGLEQVPVVLADELTDTQVKAFRLLANQSANWAEWDTELLKLEVEDLKESGFDVEMIGLDETLIGEGIDYSHIDDLLSEGLGKEAGYKADNDEFSITFTFPIERKDEVEELIQNKGKDYVTALIIKEARRGD